MQLRAVKRSPLTIIIFIKVTLRGPGSTHLYTLTFTPSFLQALPELNLYDYFYYHKCINDVFNTVGVDFIY